MYKLDTWKIPKCKQDSKVGEDKYFGSKMLPQNKLHHATTVKLGGGRGKQVIFTTVGIYHVPCTVLSTHKHYFI